MSRNPYFAHLPTWRNRQDLAYALDSLPHILDSFISSPSCSPTTDAFFVSSPSSWTCPAFPTTSYFETQIHPWSTSTTTITPDMSMAQKQQHLRSLIERHMCVQSYYQAQYNCNHHEDDCSSILQFSTRAQAMSFLIDILSALQNEPCGCDLVKGCFCSPDGSIEDHSGLAPCYVCGEWYAEEVYCRDEETMGVKKVDGRRWHEQPGSSLRHQVAEVRVRKWLDQVVVTPTLPSTPPPYMGSFSSHHSSSWTMFPSEKSPAFYSQRITSPSRCSSPSPSQMPRRGGLTRSATAPASFMIPQEILDPSCRSPGFRIKSKATEQSPSPISSPLPSPTFPPKRAIDRVAQDSEDVPSRATSSLRFSYTSERFKRAIRESMEKPSSATICVPSKPEPQSQPQPQLQPLPQPAPQQQQQQEQLQPTPQPEPQQQPPSQSQPQLLQQLPQKEQEPQQLKQQQQQQQHPMADTCQGHVETVQHSKARSSDAAEKSPRAIEAEAAVNTAIESAAVQEDNDRRLSAGSEHNALRIRETGPPASPSMAAMPLSRDNSASNDDDDDNLASLGSTPTAMGTFVYTPPPDNDDTRISDLSPAAIQSAISSNVGVVGATDQPLSRIVPGRALTRQGAGTPRPTMSSTWPWSLVSTGWQSMHTIMSSLVSNYTYTYSHTSMQQQHALNHGASSLLFM